MVKGWREKLLEVRKEHTAEQVEFNSTVKKILQDVKRSVAASSSSSSSSSSSDGSVAMEVASGTTVDAAEDEEEEDEEEELEILRDLKEEQLKHAMRETEQHTKEIGTMNSYPMTLYFKLYPPSYIYLFIDAVLLLPQGFSSVNVTQYVTVVMV